MNALLWSLHIVLAVVFAGVGAMHLAKSKADLTPKLPVLEAYRPVSIKGIGLVEVLGALGLVAAPLVGGGALVPWAALGLACVMVAAGFAYAERGEWKRLGVPAALLAAAVVVVYGRTLVPVGPAGGPRFASPAGSRGGPPQVGLPPVTPKTSPVM